MQKMNFWLSLLSSVFLIIFGIIIILKSDKWVKLIVESWPFLAFRGKFSNFEIKLMKISWIIGGSILIIFGIWIAIKTV
jgi:hypothetical protein